MKLSEQQREKGEFKVMLVSREVSQILFWNLIPEQAYVHDARDLALNYASVVTKYFSEMD